MIDLGAGSYLMPIALTFSWYLILIPAFIVLYLSSLFILLISIFSELCNDVGTSKVAIAYF